MSKPIQVEIWSDIICPFCWIGKRQFEAALSNFVHKDQVKIKLRAFRLSPNQPPESTQSMLRQKYGLTPDQLRQNQARVVDMAAGVGLEYHLDKTLSGDTLNAHRLIKLAEQTDRAEAMTERLYRAYFTEGRNLFDTEELVALAVETGFEAEIVRAFLGRSELADAVAADQHEASLTGARGVPHFVFNRRLAVSGAQPPEAFAQALQAAWEQSGATAPSQGPLCDDGICGV